MLAAAALLVVALVVAGAATGAGSASRIIDRTLECGMVGVGFPETVRYLDVLAEPRVGTNSPGARVFNGPSDADGVFVGVRTGRFYSKPYGEIGLSRSCRQIRSRIPFASTGLRGGPADRFGERHRCDAPARVLVRLRAVFASPVTLRTARRAPYLLGARGRILEASLAVATVRRVPIALATVNDTTGNAMLFVSPQRCFQTQ